MEAQHLTPIARLCHEANRAYCLALGDTSQVPWDEAEQWQRDSAVKGVEFILANPEASPAASHESWLEEKRATGWSYGPVKDAEAKTHPCFVPYDELPIEQRAKDYIFGAIVRATPPSFRWDDGEVIGRAVIGAAFMSELMKITELEDRYYPFRTSDEPWGIIAEMRQDLRDLEGEPHLPAPREAPLEPNDVDAESFAARTAQSAASQLYGLLTNENEVPIDNWFGSRFGNLADDVGALAHFVCIEGVDNPETVWRHGLGEGFIIREADSFQLLSFARRQAFEIFARVAGQTYKAIATVQKAIADEAARRAAATADPGLKREDSIFEEQEGFHDLVDHGAAYLEQQRQEGQLFGGKGDHDGDGRPGGSRKKKAPPPAPETLSIGESPAQVPPNRGGRGKRKAE